MILPRVVRSGIDVVVTLSTAQGDAEAGHHLVQDQQGTELVTDGAQPFQEAGDRRDAVHVACDRLDDDTGDLAAVLGEGFTHRIQIVEDAGQGVFGEIGRKRPGCWADPRSGRRNLP